MTDYHFRCDEQIKAKGRESQLIVPYPSGVLRDVPFEKVGFRHLNKDWIAKSEPCTKVFVMIGEYEKEDPEKGTPPRFMARDLRMRVVKNDGTSCEPFVETFQPPEQPPQPDPPKTPPPPKPLDEG
jgi:hypothetical protein